MNKTVPTTNKHTQNIFLLIGIVVWISIGVIEGSTQWSQANGLNSYIDQLPKNQDLNPYLYGSDYLTYQELQKTPLTAKFLIVIPDLNNYAARAVYFLYPRQLTFVSNIENAMSLDLYSFDYVFVYVSVSNFSGFVGGLSSYQNAYPILEKLVLLNNVLDPQSPLDNESVKSYLSKNYGNFLYKIDHSPKL